MRPVLLLWLVLSFGVTRPLFAQDVSLDVTTPYAKGESIGITYSVILPGWCDYVEGYISGSSGFYTEFWGYGGSPGGGYNDPYADTNYPQEFYYEIYAQWSYGGIETCHSTTGDDDWAIASPRTPFYSASGPNTLWWFDGATPANYPVTGTLFSDGGAGTVWEIVAGDAIVAFDGTNVGESVTVRTIARSGVPQDVIIRGALNGHVTSDVRMTVRAPSSVFQWIPPVDRCDSVYGYISETTYRIRDQFNQHLPEPVEMHEYFPYPAFEDYPANNWPAGDLNYHIAITTSVFGQFTESISGMNLAYNPFPVPGCSGNDEPVDHFDQDYRVGTHAQGGGRRASTQTIQRYVDFARQTNFR